MYGLFKCLINIELPYFSNCLRTSANPWTFNLTWKFNTTSYWQLQRQYFELLIRLLWIELCESLSSWRCLLSLLDTIIFTWRKNSSLHYKMFKNIDFLIFSLQQQNGIRMKSRPLQMHLTRENISKKIFPLCVCPLYCVQQHVLVSAFNAIYTDT